VYDKAFWDKDQSWIQRVPTSNTTSSLRFREIFNVAKYIPELPLLVVFIAGDPAWQAEKDSDEKLGAEVRGKEGNLTAYAVPFAGVGF
jgi:hypothetical protein